ncbi:hypothetical protein POX_e06529 [Penicillium oxalicum]|uniref:Ubiquitin-like-conjugating enzyme ATG10 n=1 Tax=Penicillium oxalicum (strain 114-2 / CGMCC 5302) TaxID=933388 RepID=S7ZBE5_PENO1|nr:hypothetical protein POX_e06529 [Penicillium oxalicum]EPS27564.1 hypothetical protein PDE_02507 [Penicillium oxalicum 114-2]KAI2788513.1 hypothetical protein POX_e06529 [Penicillium oxalicum]
MLSAFPFLTPEEFNCACQKFAERARSCTVAQAEGKWSSSNPLSLKISKYVEVQAPASEDADLHEPSKRLAPATFTPASLQAQAQAQNDEGEEEEQEDSEALIRINVQPILQLDYDIVLSPTYRVPVLYFTLRWHNYPGPVGLNAVYQYVVPEQYRQQLQSVGVMGGISFGYHPESGTPAFFVHPCNTADAMTHVAHERGITGETYLLVWLGLVGQSVNLHVPREIALGIETSPRQ